jgi:hypothetical protein
MSVGIQSQIEKTGGNTLIVSSANQYPVKTVVAVSLEAMPRLLPLRA